MEVLLPPNYMILVWQDDNNLNKIIMISFNNSRNIESYSAILATQNFFK